MSSLLSTSIVLPAAAAVAAVPLPPTPPSRAFSLFLQAALDLVDFFRPAWFSRAATPPQDLAEQVLCCIRSMEASATWLAAEMHADGFIVPPAVVAADAADLERVGSLSGLVAERQAKQSALRFNVERCSKLFEGDPEFDSLMDIAKNGAHVLVAADFVRSSTPQPFRTLYHQLPHTIQLHAFKLRDSHQALLLPASATANLDLHYSPVHWTAKPGKPEGRFIADMSDDSGGSALNSPEAAALLTARYGALTLPTILDLVDQLFAVADKCGGLHNVRIWKEDIVGAFNRFDFAAEDTSLLAFRVADAIDLVIFTGNFGGWTGSPAVFGVFSRALQRAIRAKISGSVDTYVDDFIGFAAAWLAHADQLFARSTITGTFGADAINTLKSVLPCSVAEAIGWILDLLRGLIYPNEKGIKKLAGVFFAVDLAGRIPTKTFQIMASLASRYSLAIIGMRPFVQSFYAESASGKPRFMSAESKNNVLMWRAVSLVLLCDPRALAVPLSFLRRGHQPTHVAMTDAGPSALGLLIGDGSLAPIGYLTYTFPFHAEDPKFQNIREFLGAVVAMVLLSSLARGPVHLAWYGDNMSSLAWVKKNLARSCAAHAAFVAFSWLQIRTRIMFVAPSHVPGASMGAIDDLSRYRPTNLDPSLDLQSRVNIGHLDRLVGLCDPTRPPSGHQSHADLLRDVISCVHDIIS
jgi:hypothetical protein